MGNTRTSMSAPFTFQHLPRGGTLVEAEDFRFQIGSYPETIKDTMKSERGVPNLFLLPDDLVDTEHGVSQCELEFPVYFNYYLKGQMCRFICHKHQVRLIVRVLREAIFGPFQLFLEREYPDGAANPAFPDLRKEMAFYKLDNRVKGGRVRLKHMIRLYVFDDHGKVSVDGHTITSLGRNRYQVDEQECEFLSFKAAPLKPGDHPDTYYVPPVFGVTIIGSGHGFDADSQTAGFILWVDGKGILVDPPVNSTLWMRQNRVNTRLIEDLILTHCHADHDSGTLQKILEEGRIRVHTTETVMESFTAKYCALTGLSRADFRTLFEFQPLRIGVRTNIAGARCLFKYNLHPIPTLGFQVEFESQSFYYSCDTLYDPDLIRSWHEKGILSAGRMADLLDVPWHSTLILHEAGIPPIHTPMGVLAAQPDEVKQRMFLVHVSASAIPADSGLRIAAPGTAHTMEIPVPIPEKSLAHRMLDVICHVDLFAEMKFKKAIECLNITRYRQCEPGEVFIRRDTPGDMFFMIMSGEVEVVHESLPQRLFFGRYDYIGETAIILNKPRNADIVARTHTELLYIEREDFLLFVRDTRLPEIVKRLDQNRSFGARWTFEKQRILAGLSPIQKNQLMCAMVNDRIAAGSRLFSAGDPLECYYLIDTGQVRVGNTLLGPGALVGEWDVERHRSEATALTDLSVFKISAVDMRAFFTTYPGTYIRLTRSQAAC